MPACRQCGQDFRQTPGRGRPRVYCPNCSRKPSKDAAVVKLQAVPAPEPSAESLTEQTIAELTEADRHASARGIRAIKLARLLDAGDYTAQGAAALAKAHHEAMELALEGAGAKADVISLIFGKQA